VTGPVVTIDYTTGFDRSVLTLKALLLRRKYTEQFSNRKQNKIPRLLCKIPKFPRSNSGSTAGHWRTSAVHWCTYCYSQRASQHCYWAIVSPVQVWHCWWRAWSTWSWSVSMAYHSVTDTVSSHCCVFLLLVCCHFSRSAR